MTPPSLRRLLAAAATVVAALAVFAVAAQPASAHASLVSVDPQEGRVYDASPAAVTLRFNEPVEVALGGVQVFDGNGDRVDAGAPEHPDGRGEEVRADLPELDDGTYVVTWRVTSSDAHPIEGAFTFQVGPDATVDDARGLAARLLSEQGGSTTVGVLYAIDRGVLFGALAVMIGGAFFVAAVSRRARALPARRIVWVGWWTTVGATVAGIGLEGAYAAGLPLADVVDPTVWGDVLDTRYGRVAVARLVLLAATVPLLRLLFRADRVLPRWWSPVAAVVAVAIAATPGISGHASTGDHVALARVSDTLHVLAMACWLGGLVMLIAVVLVRPLPDGVARAVSRFSAIALGCIAVLVVTGGFQAWRQVGSLDALRDSDFGRLLLAKLVVFGAMVVAAAFSREAVNRHFFARAAEDDARAADRTSVLVAAGSLPERTAGSVPERTAGSVPERTAGSVPERTAGSVPFAPDTPDADTPDDERADEREARRLRASVLAEVGFAIVVLTITALLVNTAPARTESTEPVALTMQGRGVFADVTVAPGAAGPNDIHITVLPTRGGDVTAVEMQLTRPDGDLAPFDVPLRPLGPGHYYAPGYRIPFPGDWTMVVRAQLGATDVAVLTDDFTLR